MAVNNDTAQTGPLYGDGSNTAFPFDFIAASVDEVAVYVDGLRLASGAYSVTLQGDGTGTVNTTTAPAAGAEIYLASDPLFTETVQFDRYGPYFPDQINPPLDRAAIRSIYLRGVAQRALLVPIGETAITFPSAAVRASKFLAFDAAGNPITSTGTGADAGLRTDLAATGGAALVKASDGNTVQANLDAKTRTFEQFLPVDYDYTTDDCSAAIVTAATWSATNNATVVFSRRYRITSTPTITTDGFHFDFQGAQFDLAINEADTTKFGTISNGATGPVGILVKGADHPRLTGTARFMGQGTAGTTRQAGIVFDTCTFAETGDFFFDTLAAGMMTLWCTSCNFTGSVSANGLDGAQTFSATFDDAGTARVVAECVNCNYGDTLAIANHKPIVYLSTSPTSAGVKQTNTNCTFGRIMGTGQTGSLDCMLLGIRSAKGCKFAGSSGTGFNVGISLTRYGTDTGYEIDGNDFGSLNVTILDTGSSADNGISTDFDNDAVTAALKIGSNHIGSVVVNGPAGGGTSNNQLFGVLLIHGNGSLTIDSLVVNGCYYPVQVSDSTLTVNKAQFAGFGGAPVRYGKGAALSIRQADILTGSTVDAQTGLVAYASTIGTGGTPDIDLPVINYAQNAIGTNPTYILYDGTNSPQNIRIGHIHGTGGSAQARWGVDEYSVRDGRLLRTTIPTVGSFMAGDRVYNAAPAAGGVDLWQRLTTGSAHVAGTDWSPVRAIVQQTGWTAGTGTANKGAFAAYAGATRGAAYSQTEAQATDDAAKAASQRILALEQAVRALGGIN